MEKRIMLHFVIVINIFFSSSLFSQQIISAGASSIKNSTTSMDYSIGQLFFQSVGDNSNSMTEGIFQYQIESILTSQKFTEIDIKIYPNPTSRFLNIDHQTESTIYIFDIKGNMLYEKVSLNKSYSIDLKKFEGNTFIVSIKNKDSGKYYSFKIIKSK